MKSMNLLIVGVSGSGKSKLGDLIRNTIFRLDDDARITTRDPDRENKSFGDGKNVYNISVRQVPEDQKSTPVSEEDLESSDVVIVLTNDSVNKWFKEVYS